MKYSKLNLASNMPYHPIKLLSAIKLLFRAPFVLISMPTNHLTSKTGKEKKINLLTTPPHSDLETVSDHLLALVFKNLSLWWTGLVLRETT